MNRISLFIILMIVVVLAGQGRSYEPSEIENPNLADRREYVADPGDLLEIPTRNRVNSMLQELRDSTTAEVAVAVVPELNDQSIEEFSEEVFTAWGLGKKDKDNGVLFLISPGSRRVRIQTGYGSEEVLTDALCSDIIQRVVIPRMKEGDLNGAVENAVDEIVRVMSDEKYAEALRSSLADNRSGENFEPPISKEGLLAAVGGVALLLFLVAAGLYIFDRIRFRKGSVNEKALRWRSSLPMLWLAGGLSLGLGLIFPILAYYHYRRARNRRRNCPRCGHAMKKMDEVRDNDYLTDSQDLEERLGTVDYDVWVCPECDAVEKIPYKEKQLKYTECPNCHTIAYGPVGKWVVVPPTTRYPGEGEQLYECRYCHHQHRKRYRIPKKPDETAAVLGAAAILGAASRRGRGGGGGFGGGGFGGGFGGGMTGGGGASGSW